MISVLIPVYNIEVVSLVNELSKQLSHLNIEGEILVFDDFSSKDYRESNRSISNLNHVFYRELDQNYGRTGIRQLLASSARFGWLLFLDSDSRIIYPDFLQRYFSSFKNGFDIYTGGRVYPSKPIECNKALHWKYGTRRESAKGNKTAFHTNNFCIKKAIFGQLNFPELLKQYGHEDTWMEIELERLGKGILHINNCVEHTRIEDTDVFLKKTEQALQNLLLLENAVDKTAMVKHIALYRSYRFIQKGRLEVVVNFIYSLIKHKIIQNLKSCSPSLSVFDFYRLYNLIRLSKQNK